MSEKIVQLNEEAIKGQIKELVRGRVEETLNGLLEAEAQKLTRATRYERSEERQVYRSGHYQNNLTTTSGDVRLNVPRLKGVTFATATIERYRRRESSAEEAPIKMYLAGVCVSRKYPYVYVDGIYLRRNWGGEYENVAILVAIAVNEDGYCEVLGAAEGMKEDKASWVSFFQWLKGRGLEGVKLIIEDKCLGMLEAVGEVYPETKYQRCTPDTGVPFEHWTRIRTSNVIERLNREICCRTHVVRSFSDGNSALMLVRARLRHVAGTQ